MVGIMVIVGLPWWLRRQRIRPQCRRPGFNPWVGKIPWRRKWQCTPVFLPGESHGQRSVAGYSPWGGKELDMTKVTEHMFRVKIKSYLIFKTWVPLCFLYNCQINIYLLLFSLSVMSDSLWPYGLQLARLPCPSPSSGACSNSCPWSRLCHPTISSSVIPFSSCLQSFPASGSFPMSHFLTSGGQSIGVSASSFDSILPMNI